MEDINRECPCQKVEGIARDASSSAVYGRYLAHAQVTEWIGEDLTVWSDD